MPPVATGLDRLVASLRSGEPLPELQRAINNILRTGRLGLITNPSAVDASLASAVDVLRAAGANLVALFGPEHGIRGDAPDGAPVASGVDARTGIPCYSLYGDCRQPAPAMLEGLDLLLYDVQDVGARFYTFEATMSLAMEACSRSGVPFAVLDRPNPIGGRVEGPILADMCRSFVGLHPIPIRHGCTFGELAVLFHHRFTVGDAPHVIRTAGWCRYQYWEETSLPWVLPSPNMPTPETALVYPGTCLIEGTNVSEGRGTTRPFEFLGAPWLNAEDLAARLNALDLPGARFRPQRFQPSASKHAGRTCEGAQLHVLDRAAFHPVLTGVAVLAVLKEQSGGEFEWRRWANGVYSIDLLAGTPQLREALDAGVSWREIVAGWGAASAAFAREKRALELYP